jgi:hypothetical protein
VESYPAGYLIGVDFLFGNATPRFREGSVGRDEARKHRDDRSCKVAGWWPDSRARISE